MSAQGKDLAPQSLPQETATPPEPHTAAPAPARADGMAVGAKPLAPGAAGMHVTPQMRARPTMRR
jgi:hypothetical protein